MKVVVIKDIKVVRGFMEFQNRNNGQHQVASTGAPQHSGRSKKLRGGRGMRIISAVLLVAIGLLIASLAMYVATGGNKKEGSYVEDDKFQAVFLNGGQVYFGKIRELNDKFITIDNIYYLRVNDQVQPDTNQEDNQGSQDISLAKLGCELHGPEDFMVINHEQVTFWENLKDDGQVVKAITEFVKANPDGQKCQTS